MLKLRNDPACQGVNYSKEPRTLLSAIPKHLSGKQIRKKNAKNFENPDAKSKSQNFL